MREIKIKGKLMALFNIVFCITFGYIFFDTLVNPSQLFAKINPVIVVILAAGVITGMYKLNSLLEKATRKNLILMSILSFLIIAFLQLFFIKFFKVTPLWDFGTVYESAYNALGSFTQFDSYFYNCYPNNIPLFIFMASIIKMLDSMGIGNFYTALMLVNMSAVLLALASLYAFIYRKYGIQRATLFSLFSILITPLYSYSTIIYTDTLSMLFPILGVLLYDIYYHCKSKSRYGVLVLLGLVLTLGTLMKTNVIILVVGIFIHYFMTQKSVKALGTIAIVGGILFGLNSAYHKAIEPYIPIPMEDMGYPMTHWIMMGLKGNGGYNGDDDAFTMFLKDDYHLAQEDITKEHITVIKERLNEFGFGGFMNHLKNKINFTWSDGTYYAPDKLMKHPLPESDFGEYVFGERNQFFVYLSQVSHLILLFFILQSGFKLFRQNGFESVMTITLFGVFLFLLIWETRSRYVILFIPMMIALASFGFDEFVAKVSKHLKVNKK